MFKNKIAVVSGAASGMGFATSQLFIANGAKVIGVDCNAEKLAESRKRLGDAFDGRVCDLASVSAIRELAKGVNHDYGVVNYLVNCAGFVHPVLIDDFEESDFDRQIGVMLKAPVFMVRYFIEMLKKADGACIIHIGSTGATTKCVGPGTALYGIAKAGLEKFTYHCACDLPGIRCNIIHPGPIQTPIHVSSGESEEAVNQRFEYFRKEKIPVQKTGEAMDIAEAVIFLCSDKAAFINGASIVVDGGMQCCECGGMRK